MDSEARFRSVNTLKFNLVRNTPMHKRSHQYNIMKNRVVRVTGMALSLVLVLGMLLHFQHPLSATQLSMPNSYASPSELEDAKDEKDKVEDEQIGRAHV